MILKFTRFSAALSGVLVIALSVVPSHVAFADTSTNPSTTAYCPHISGNILQGSHGTSVLELQKFLAGHYGIAPSTIETGYYGPITQRYVARLQKEHSLPGSGVVAGLTRAVISLVCRSTGTIGKPVSTPVNVTPTDTPQPPVIVSSTTSAPLQGTPVPNHAPIINSITPSSGPFGTSLTLIGSNFTGANQIGFMNIATRATYSVNSPIGSANGTVLTPILTSCPPVVMSGNSISQGCTGVYIPGGSYAVTVTNENGTSNIVPFTVTTSIVDNTPTITNISPSSGAFGAALTIVGTHFTSSDNQIVFKGLSTGSTYYVNSPQTSTDGTTLNAKVTSCPPPVIIANAMAQSCSGVVIPAGQYTVTVVNSNGTSNAVSFTITAGTTTTTAAPTITSVTPSSGAQGGSFTITGSNFTSTGNTITLLAISAGSSGMTATAYSVNSPQTSADGNTIQFTLTSCPPTAPLCPGVAIREGTYSLSVSNANGSSNTVTFTVAQTM